MSLLLILRSPVSSATRVDIPFDVTSGTTLTTANTPGATITNGAGSTSVASNLHSHSGVAGAQMNGAASQASIVRVTIPTTNSAAARAYFWYSGTAPATQERISGPRNNSPATVARASVTTTGHLALEDAAGTTQWTSAAVLPTTGLFRTEMWATVGNATTTGRIHLAYYQDDSLTPIETVDLSAFNLGLLPFTAWDFGRLSTGAAAVTQYVDDIAVQTETTSELGPLITGVSTGATVAATASITAAGVVSKSSGASLAATATVTASIFPVVSMLTDTFTGTTIDAAKWNFTAGITQSGALTIPCTSAYPSAQSVNKYVVTGSSATVQVVQTAGPGTGTCETLMILALDASNDLRMERVGGSIAYGSRTGGTATMNYPAWDGSLDKWWRISESVGTVTFAVSSTGAAWTTIGTISTPAWASGAVNVLLMAGYYGTETSPQPAIFDNLNVAPTMPTTTAGTIHSGVWAPDPVASTTTWQTNLNTFDADAGKRPDLVVFYQQWSGTPAFPSAYCDIIFSRGQTPVITWEPWLYTGGVTQSTYSLANIIAGNFDTYITTWANAAKAYGQTVYLRFAHEMNGNWYPWAEGVNGNTAGQYASAWQHVKAIFTANSVTNVKWVWCPNEPYAGSTSMTGMYPGSTYVDVVGYDGYATTTNWRTFDQFSAAAIDQIRALDATHPLWVVETGATESGGNKAAFIADMFTTLKYRTEVTALCWWNDTNGANNYSIETTTGATTAYAAGIADARYAQAGGSATVTTTATITAVGAVAKSTGSAATATATITSAGVVGRSAGATLATTAAITAAGVNAVTGAATLGSTATIAAAGATGRATGASLTTTAAVTAAGTTGTTGTTSLSATAAITTAGSTGRATNATLTTTAAINAAGSTGLAAGAALNAAATTAASGAGAAGVSLTATAGITAAGTTATATGASLAASTTITTAGQGTAAVTAAHTTTLTASGTIGRSTGATAAHSATIAAAGSTGLATGAALASTAAITAAGSTTVGLGGTSTLNTTATITTAGVVARSTGATLPTTATVTTAGSTNRATGSSTTATATVTTAGVVGKTAGATVAATAAITAAGNTVGGTSATLAATASVAAAGQVGASTGATVAASATTTAAGARGTLSGVDASTIITITATGVVGVGTGAQRTTTATITASGTLAAGNGAAATTTATITASGSTGRTVGASVDMLALITAGGYVLGGDVHLNVTWNPTGTGHGNSYAPKPGVGNPFSPVGGNGDPFTAGPGRGDPFQVGPAHLNDFAVEGV